MDETIAPERRLFCNRTLNVRGLRAIGFDMDYTLVHYRTEVWERRAYEHLRERLAARGWPVAELDFDPEMTTRGLILDTELGNVVKANRFGYVKRAAHGTRMLDPAEVRRIYGRQLVDLRDRRWEFLNTFFSLSEACMYAQLVDLADAGRLPGPLGYAEIYRIVRSSLDAAHMEGALKAEVVGDPERFVEDDPELPLALMDLRASGKKLLLVTNSEWAYTDAMMGWAIGRHLGEPARWRELFDVVVVEAGKPAFFETQRPLFEVVDVQRGWLAPARTMREGGVFHGGSAAHVEHLLGVPGEDILYVGDHIFADVHVSKEMLRWRTGLVLRELEAELRALEAFREPQRELDRLMAEKERLEHRFSLARLALLRLERGHGPRVTESPEQLRARMTELRARLVELAGRIGQIAARAGTLVNERWGPLMRAGNDKSHLARQIERYADLYTSRVSNFLYATPFVYLRSPRGSLPHDPGA
ncbi:MAG: HAD-IG family 5'-nucleotidase [Myxococcales bacterium]|nr:HAD-IG family 5'-nucleotidase [Myxococcales bacterium]